MSTQRSPTVDEAVERVAVERVDGDAVAHPQRQLQPLDPSGLVVERLPAASVGRSRSTSAM